MYTYIYACTFVFAYSCHPFTHCHPNPKHTAAEAAVIPPNQNPPDLCRELGTHMYGVHMRGIFGGRRGGRKPHMCR